MPFPQLVLVKEVLQDRDLRSHECKATPQRKLPSPRPSRPMVFRGLKLPSNFLQSEQQVFLIVLICRRERETFYALIPQ